MSRKYSGRISKLGGFEKGLRGCHLFTRDEEGDLRVSCNRHGEGSYRIKDDLVTMYTCAETNPETGLLFEEPPS